MDGRKDEAAKLLLTSWEEIIRNILIPEYVVRLTEEIVERKKKWESNRNNKNDEYLREEFEDGVLYINVDNEQVIYDKPNKIIEWMLRREEIENISQMINDKNKMRQKNDNDKEIMERAATKIQQWWKKRLFWKNFEELKRSDKPSLRVVRRLIPLLLHRWNDGREDKELEENRLYAIKLINANRYLEEKMIDLNDKIAKLSINEIQFQDLQNSLKNIITEAERKVTADKLLSVDKKDRMKLNRYEIIFFYLQTEVEYLARLMGKYSNDMNALSDLFRGSVLPVYSYGMSNREMSLLALLLAKYLQEEIKQLNNPFDFRNSSSCVILQILIESYTRMELQRLQIAELNQKLDYAEYRKKYFNLNPIYLFESITGIKPKNIDEAMSNSTVIKIFNDSKQFLMHWANVYADILFGKVIEYPDIVRYIAVSARNDLKKRFPTESDAIIIQAISAWLYKGCWMNVISAENLDVITEKSKEYPALAFRKTISKFIEYSILNFGYGAEKYWLNSLNEAITKINAISEWHFMKFIVQNPPVYSYNIEDKEWDKYGPYKPVLHITMHQLRVTLQRLQNDINEVIPQNSRLNRFITDTLLPDDNMEQYVTFHLHPFIPDEIDNNDKLLRRTIRYVEQCLLCGCPGNNLIQLLARHTLQKEEEVFRKLLHHKNDQPTLDDTKCHIIRQLSTLEKAKRVTSINNYQNIVTAIAKDISREDNYRKSCQLQLMTIHKLVCHLENTRFNYRKRLERYVNYLKKFND
ncbi:unnamed protein product [Cercopithifilaria johnstoni]|uniref:Ras-GAP domain-containing protein n=1 Tax=Cercopithifilaria johnstoni TaxID=2874296 RepID=A0A8J2MH77_9BILA|nr:unnamed protein product [Cercopithifilaria johnstoni]